MELIGGEVRRAWDRGPPATWKGRRHSRGDRGRRDEMNCGLGFALIPVAWYGLFGVRRRHGGKLPTLNGVEALCDSARSAVFWPNARLHSAAVQEMW